MEDDLLRYFPTKGGYVVGKSKRADYPNLDTLPDYNPEEDLDFLPLLSPRKVCAKNTQLDSSQVSSNEVGMELCLLEGGEDNSAVEDNSDSEDEVFGEPPEIDLDDEIRVTGEIQATLASNVEFKEFVVHTDGIDGEYEMAERDDGIQQLFVGQQWNNHAECRDYLKNLSIQNNYCIKQVKNTEVKQQYKCMFFADCEWKVYCARLPNRQTFECKSGHFIHTCESFHGLKHPLANAKWVAKVMLEAFKAHPKYKPLDFQTEVKKNHKVDISYYTAWHGYNLTLEKVMGSYEDGYKMLPSLCEQIMDENPRNIASCRTDPSSNRFKSLCIAYRVSIDGFRLLCRPMLGLDGTHLKGKYGGVMLAIVALDANNGLFPIAIYICQSECKETWLDFLSILAPELKQHERALTFISDRQKGLIEGIAINFSDVNHHHRFCFRHLYKNFKKKHPGKNLEFMVWRAARSYSEVGHKIWMERLKEAKASAAEWFNDKPVEQWARAYFDKSSKCDHITSNFCEAFNAWILDFRFMPMTKLVQKYHLLMMRIFFDREQVGKKWTDGGVVPRVTNIIKKHLYFQHEFTKQPSTELIWTVSDTKKDISWNVHLLDHTCTCNAWEISGIPCVHAIVASLYFRTRNFDQYVHPYMKVENYRQLYVPYIKPLKDRALWNKPRMLVLPLKVVRGTGRPRSQRRRDRDEELGRNSRQYMCGKCYTFGHNRKTCSGATAENVDQAPDTFTGPHVRPDPATRPQPPASHGVSSSATPRTRGTKRKGGGIGGRGSRGGTGGRGSRGERATSVPTSTTIPSATTSTPTVSTTAEPSSSTASTTVAFGRTTTIGSTSSRGRPLRGKWSRWGSAAYTNEGHQVLNPRQAARPPTGRGAGGRPPTGRGTTTVRGNMPRMMNWLGTPEQWANEE